MRLLTMLLMLCLALLAAASAQLKCDRSLITGVTNEQIKFDDATKTLTCVEKEKSFMMIHFPDIDKYKSIPYVSLKCDKDGGWKARMPKYGPNDELNYEEHTIADASAAVNIKCDEYCRWFANSDIVMEKILSSGLPTVMLKPAQGCRMFVDRRTVVEQSQCTPFEGQFGKERIGWINQKGELLSGDIKNQEMFDTKCYIDGEKICDRSLITGVADEEIEFKLQILKCIQKENSLMAIHILSQSLDGSIIRSEPYTYLICGEFGWTEYQPEVDDPRSLERSIEKLIDASALLKISCVEYCAFTGAGLNVNIGTSTPLHITLESDSGCNIYHGLRQVYMHAKCAFASKYRTGWYGWKNLITNQITRPEHFDVWCSGAPQPPCLVSMPGNHDLLNVDLPTKTVTCRRTSDYVLTGIIVSTVSNTRYGTLQCDETSGWKTKSRLEGNQLINLEHKVAEASSTLPVGCVEYCKATGEGIQFNQIGEGAEVTCPIDFKLYHNNLAISKATCDLTGEWTLENAGFENTNDKTGSFECRPTKCYVPNIDGARFDKATKNLTCDSNGNALIAMQVNSELFTSVSCDIVSGWSGGLSSGGMKKFAEATAELDAKCVKYCTPSEESGQVQSVSGEAHSTQFSCNGNNGNGEALEIKMDEQFVAPRLACHMDRGYTDASGVKLSGPLEAVKLDCAIRPAPTTTTSSQNPPSSTKSSNDVPTTTHGSKTEEAEAQSSVTVVCASIGGVLLLIIAVVVIVIVLKKKRPENNSERPKAGSKEKHRKGNEKSGEQNSSGQ